MADSRRLMREAIEAYKAQSYTVFLERARAAADLRPTHQTCLYIYASALALNGRADEAMATLENIAAMGMLFDPAKDDDFASLRGSPRFAQIVDAFHRNGQATTSATPAFTIPERGIISEGIAFDPRTHRFFVSSVRNGAIDAIDARGRVSMFVHDQPWGIFGMAVDARRRVLWASTSALPQSKTFREADRDRAAVLEIDLDSGRVRRTIRPPDKEKHLFGDVAVTPDGSVFVSDSVSPSIYRIRNGVMEPFIEAGPFASLQGLAPSGRLLYASDYSKGIFAIDLTTRDAHILPLPPHATLLGVDGLYVAGARTLIGTQNGTAPQRVVRIDLARDGLSVERVDVLASNQSDFDDITLGVVAGDGFYFNGAGQWALFGDDGNAPAADKLKPAQVLSVRIR